uniref:BHLH domain-containing protein n=1 Tax=Caenorhabditis japonica TaxID=281687 RepID=A0A8R1I6Z0_CAEJA
MVLLTTPPPMYGANRKTTQEKKRRDEINAKIRELQQIMQQDSEGDKMTQGEILNRAVELVNRMESESPGPSNNPNRKGFFDGFSQIEMLTSSFIKNLGMSPEVCQEYLHKAKYAFDKERNALLMSSRNSSPLRKHSRKEDDEESSSSSSPRTSEPGTSVDRKEVKKNREQDRRDRQGEAFDALKAFIISNKLMNSHQVEKMQRLNTLDIIINYIRNKRNNFVSCNGQERTLYNCAVSEGQKTATSTAFSFFKKDRHLVARCADLEKFFEFSLNPKPLVGFPTPPALPITPLQPFQSTSPIKVPLFPPFPFYPFRGFPFLPVLTPTPPSQTSPSYSLDSPPPSSDTSSSSIETTPNENSKKPKAKLFRPWE